MRIVSLVVVATLGLTAFLVSCAPSEPPTARELMRERIMERRAAMLANERELQGGNGQVLGTGNATYRSPDVPGTDGSLRASSEANGGARAVEIRVGPETRRFLVRVPANLSGNPGVVLAFHGGGGNASRFMSNSSIVGEAERRGFIAVFPDGNGLWNDGRLRTAGGSDDVRFVREIIEWLEENLDADADRVFATGISNGGMMALKLACDAPGLVRAIAPVAANFTESTYSSCRPSRPTPVMMFSGTRDPLMLFEGGRPDPSALPGRDRQPLEDIVSAERSIRLWARLARCGEPTATQLPDRSNDETTVTRISFSCPNTQVVLYRIEGGGHTWPGARPSGRLARIVGPTSQDINATSLMLDFFERYGL